MANYVDNKHFEELIKTYMNGDKSIEEELFKCFDLIIDGVMAKFNFKIDKDEAKQDCYLLILKVLRNFNPENGAAFNYFTTVIVNNMRLLYTKNKRNNERLQGYIDFKLGVYSPSSANIEPV